jgi:hypothetical protein
MKLKTLALTIAALLALAIVAYYLQRPPSAAASDARLGQPVFDTRVLGKAARLRLADQGKTVLLAKQSDGKWIDSSYYDLPADFAKLSHFIDDLSNAKIQRLVTRSPERLARLDFKDTSIALLDSAGQALWAITLGKNAEGGGRFVKFDDEQKGYLANLSLFLDADAKNWADSLLVDLKPDDIAGIEVGFETGEPVAASRAKKEDAWAAAKAPAGQRIKGDRITALLSSFGSLRFQDTADLTDANVEAARQHSRTVKLTTFDHKTITLQLGRKPEEKQETGERKPDTGKIEATTETGGQKPEAGSQPAAPKALGEGGKSEVGEPKPEVSNQKPEAASLGSAQNSEPNLSTVASAKVEILNPEPAAVQPPPAKPKEPKVETIPAGPVYVFIASSDPAAPVNALMKKRAFQIYGWNYTSLPQKSDELYEPVPAPPPVEKKPETRPAEPKPEAKPAEKPAENPKS